jgi:hypothetical protein
MHFADKVLTFYRGLRIAEPLPEGVEVMNPYQNDTAFHVCRLFYEKFYNDDSKRFLILGINPGRNGAGITGIPFTDPVKLEARFSISNAFQKKPELSADFMYMMIDAYGGPEKFFRKFFINSVSPLGFVQNGKNINYYDIPALRQALTPFVNESMKRILKLNIDKDVAFCLGEGANYKYLTALNDKMGYFGRIIPLAHPRFIMQYKRKQVGAYLDEYLQKLNSVS